MHSNFPKSDPISFSCMVDSKPKSREAEIIGIQPRSLEAWQDSATAEVCSDCRDPFGFGIVSSRKHHCRHCGRAFCDGCSSKRAIIPMFISKLPVPDERHKHENRKFPVRVCNVCHDRLQNLAQVTDHVSAGDDPGEKELNVDYLSQLATTSSDSLLKQWANFELSAFREIQYYLVDHVFTAKERQMLWANRNHFIGHNKWFVQLLKSINYMEASHSVLEEMDRLLDVSRVVSAKNGGSSLHARPSCWKLMCSRNCQPRFTLECAIQLLNQTVKSNPVRMYALSFLDECEEAELLCTVPYLVRHSLYAPVLYKWLIERCKTSEQLAADFFWELQTYLVDATSFSLSGHKVDRVRLSSKNASHGEYVNVVENSAVGPHILQVVTEILSEWKRAVPQKTRDKIYSSLACVSLIRQAYNGPLGAHGVAKAFSEGSSNCYYFPIHVDQGMFSVNVSHVKVMDSATKPVVIPLVPCNETPADDSHGQEEGDMSSFRPMPPPYLYKCGDVRKEQIISNAIRMAKLILKKDEGLDLPILDYSIRSCSARDGFIEMVENCVSLADLRERKQDILPWIIERNEHMSAGQLRDRFVDSCAAYSVISYLFGIGDRHLNNLLIAPNGSLLHIDFSFVLGQDPKPMEKPAMRITGEFLNAIGGIESATYKRFKSLASNIYNCLRRHVNLFSTMLKLLVEAVPQIQENGVISEDVLMKEIRRRFAPGEGDKEAEIIIQTHIHNSTTQTLQYALIDFLHSKSKLPQAVIGSLWSVAGLSSETPDDTK